MAQASAVHPMEEGPHDLHVVDDDVLSALPCEVRLELIQGSRVHSVCRNFFTALLLEFLQQTANDLIALAAVCADILRPAELVVQVEKVTRSVIWMVEKIWELYTCCPKTD